MTKTQDALALALAQDTIRIALRTAGYSNVDKMNQFERASAILDMAQELAAYNDVRDYIGEHCEIKEIAKGDTMKG